MAGAASIFGGILQGAGSTIGRLGTMKQRFGESEKMAFDAGVDDRNAELSRQDQLLRIEGGRMERANIDKDASQSRGQARVGFAAGNVALDEGSALDVDTAFAEQSAREKSASLDQQKVDVTRLKNEELGLIASARLKRKGARGIRKSAKLEFAGGTIGDIGSVFSGQMGGK